jgi:hypothetical protein
MNFGHYRYRAMRGGLTGRLQHEGQQLYGDRITLLRNMSGPPKLKRSFALRPLQARRCTQRLRFIGTLASARAFGP